MRFYAGAALAQIGRARAYAWALIHKCDVDDAAFLAIFVPLQSPQNDQGEALAIGGGLDILDAVRVVSDNSESAKGPALCSHAVLIPSIEKSAFQSRIPNQSGCYRWDCARTGDSFSDPQADFNNPEA